MQSCLPLDFHLWLEVSRPPKSTTPMPGLMPVFEIFSVMYNLDHYLSWLIIYYSITMEGSKENSVGNWCPHHLPCAVRDDNRPVFSLRIVRSTDRFFNEACQVISLVVHRSDIILDQGTALGRAHHIPTIGMAKADYRLGHSGKERLRHTLT